MMCSFLTRGLPAAVASASRVDGARGSSEAAPLLSTLKEGGEQVDLLLHFSAQRDQPYLSRTQVIDLC